MHAPHETPAARPARRAGFTLIELLAVLFIMGLVLGIGLPNLTRRSERPVIDAAEKLASNLAYARQRAVATGSPHRIVFDLDAGAWWLEVWPEEASPFSAPPAPATPGAQIEVQLVAPQTGVLEFQPLAGPFGRPRMLGDDVFFEGIETLALGAVLSGQVAIVFEGDGTADPARFLLANESGDTVELQLARLADEIRIVRD